MKLNTEVFKRSSTWANIAVAALGPFAAQVAGMELTVNQIILMLAGNFIVAACQFIRFSE